MVSQLARRGCLIALIIGSTGGADTALAQDGWRLNVTAKGFATYSALSVGRAIPLETGDYLRFD